MESYCIQPESQYMYMGTVSCSSLLLPVKRCRLSNLSN